MNYYISFLILILIFPFSSLQAQVKSDGPVKVEVRNEGDNFQLYRGGEPYYIKGIGGQIMLDSAKAYGANSIRTWNWDNGLEVLDEAHARGMTVLMGLWVGQERQGFDYEDEKAVAAQLEGFKQVVLSFKDHPALLMWGIGNENDLEYSNFKCWDAINDIAKMIHELDPNHPTMTVTAGFDPAETRLIMKRAPHIDIYGVNTYAALIGIDYLIRLSGWPGPYIITEWGPSGHWEVPKTAWGAAIEQTSSEKAAVYRERYEKGILADSQRCLGSYVFQWDQKQETTPTWYGLFLESGEETEVMDMLQQVWSGKFPANRAPHLESYTLNDKDVLSSLYVSPSVKVTAVATITDADGDSLRYKWELLPESTDIKSGGDFEKRPEAVKIKVLKNEGGTLEFKAPGLEGSYRLFVYAFDGHGNAATANFPFYVKRPVFDKEDVSVFK